MKIELPFTKFIVKPALATTIMGVCSYAIYMLISGLHPGRMATVVAILIAIVIYGLALIALKLFSKEELYMIPYGSKIYKILEKMGIYKEAENTVK